MSSAARQQVDRAASQKNIEPTAGQASQQGKTRSRVNGLRHGLTGQVIMMAEEDRAPYEQFCANIRAAYNPEGSLETQIAQSIADDEWRLNRIRAVEMVSIARGHFNHEAEVECPNTQIHAAMTQANVFWNNSGTLSFYSLYEHRLTRNLRRSEARLKSLQADRIATLEKALEEARLLAELADSEGETYDAPADFPTLAARNGFVFSNSQLQRAIERDRRLAEARNLRKTLRAKA